MRARFFLVGLVAFATLVVMGILPDQKVKANPGTGTLFGTDAFLGNLITIDPLTGAGTAVGLILFEDPFPSLAVDPTTGTMYGGGTSRSGGSPDIYTVSPGGAEPLAVKS